MNKVVRLRNYPRLPKYFTPDTTYDRELLRSIGWKGSSLIRECEIDHLLAVVSAAGCWLSTPTLRD